MINLEKIKEEKEGGVQTMKTVSDLRKMLPVNPGKKW